MAILLAFLVALECFLGVAIAGLGGVALGLLLDPLALAGDDDLVLAKASERFVEKAKDALKGRQGADKIVLALRPGPHGFDTEVSTKEGWLDEALKTVVETWLE